MYKAVDREADQLVSKAMADLDRLEIELKRVRADLNDWSEGRDAIPHFDGLGTANAASTSVARAFTTLHLRAQLPAFRPI